jgi:hypothetical protein
MCDSCNSEKEQNNSVTRRSAIKKCLVIAGGALLGLLGLLTPSKKAQAGYGACSLCACPAYSGSGHVCANCGHNYQSHW